MQTRRKENGRLRIAVCPLEVKKALLGRQKRKRPKKLSPNLPLNEVRRLVHKPVALAGRQRRSSALRGSGCRNLASGRL
jgi:hypothetical protein